MLFPWTEVYYRIHEKLVEQNFVGLHENFKYKRLSLWQFEFSNTRSNVQRQTYLGYLLDMLDISNQLT
jgi:hypothetical protein